MTHGRDSGDSGQHEGLDPSMIRLEPLGSGKSLKLEPLGGRQEPASQQPVMSRTPSADSLELAADDDIVPDIRQDSGYTPKTTDLLPVNPTFPHQPGKHDSQPQEPSHFPVQPSDEPPQADLAAEVQKATAPVEIDRSADEEIRETEAVILVRQPFWETASGAIIVMLVVSFFIGAFVALYYIRSLYSEPITDANIMSAAFHTFMVWLVSGLSVAPLLWYGYSRIID